eukprot:293881_1
MAYWLLGCFIFHAFGQSTNGLNKGNVTCGSSVEAVYDDNSLWHTYDLKINTFSDVNFDLCSSELDLWIGIYNEYNLQASIADEHCPGGDGCDKCSISNNNYPENFTIPFMLSGLYTIHISPYYVGDHGAYGLKIKCNPSSILPNTTTIYTTPIPSEPPTNITPSPTFNILSIIKCGDLLSGELLNNDDINYYYFNLTNDTHYLQFDSCLSSYRTALYLYDMNFSLLYQGEDNIDCGLSERLFITEPLQSGQYILKISGWGVDGWHKFGIWRLSVHCKSVTPILNPTYILRTDMTPVTWFQANIFCDAVYKTSLATVITFENFEEAKQLISLDYPSMTLIGTWIGLYNEGIINSNTSKWQWADGTLCHDKYTTSCNGIMTDNFSGYPMAAYISYSSIDKQSLQIYSHAAIGHGLSWIDDYQFGFMCNHPNGSYGMNANRTFPQCYNIDGCWNNLHCCGMIDPIVSDTWDLHRPPIAYWNNKLFVVGIRNLHYTYLKITNNSNNTNNFNWSNVIYNQIQQSGAEFYQTHYADYIHFQSSLYLLAIDELTDYDITTLLHIDLDSITTTANAVPRIIEGELLTYQTVDSCMVSNNNHIWIITRTYVAIYNIITGAWTRSKQPLKHNDTSPHACGITNNYKFIYIFGWQDVEHVFKYNIEIDKFVYLDTPNICWMLTAMHAITAPNGKIYIHGCYISSWKTAIFDPIKEQFEVNTVDIDSPIDNIRHKEAQLTIFDDNILLLLQNSQVHHSLSMYFSVTEISAVHFKKLDDVWPSDTFAIEYYINDFNAYFSKNTKPNYQIGFYSNDTIEEFTIYYNLTINDCSFNDKFVLNWEDNISYDGCIFDGINLQQHLSVEDDHIDELKLFPIVNTESYGSNLLIRPNHITVTLQRCIITLDELVHKSTTQPTIWFNYYTSSNCFSKSTNNYSFNIVANRLNVSKEVIIDINNNNIFCLMIDRENDSVNSHGYCNDKYIFIQYKQDYISDLSFNVCMKSNNMDLKVKPSCISLLYESSPNKKLYNQFFSFIFIVSIICIFCSLVHIAIFFCPLRNTHVQVTVESQQLSEICIQSPNDHDMETIIIANTYETFKLTLGSNESVIGPCDGKCDSKFGAMIDLCITTDIKQMHDYHIVLIDSFGCYGSGLRRLLIDLMEKTECNFQYYKEYNQLANKYFVFNSDSKVEGLADLLNEFAENGFDDILHQLSYEACKTKRNLMTEMLGDNNWKINTCHGGNINTSNQGGNIRKNGENNENMRNNEKNNNDDEDKDDGKDNINDGNGDGDGEKQYNIFDEYPDEIKYYWQRLVEVKQHPNYTIMIEKGYGLSDYELISVIYYCDSTTSCYKMKEYHRKLQYDCKWRNLYYHLTNAVDKMHKCFHLKNSKRDAYTLFHGTSCNQLDMYSTEQLFMKTVTSFSSLRAVALDFAQNGLILAIDNAGRSIYRGTLRAADIDWISIHREREYIVLPTTFHQFKKLDEEKLIERGWNDLHELNVYVTNKYKSNKNIRCIHADDISFKAKPNYDEVPTELKLKLLLNKEDILSVTSNSDYNPIDNKKLRPVFSVDDIWMNSYKQLRSKMRKMRVVNVLNRSKK